MKKIIFLIVFLLFAGLLAFFMPETLGLSILERKAPLISFKTEESQMYPNSLKLTASDAETGLYSIIVYSIQNDQQTELLNKQYETPIVTDELNISYLKLKEGPAKFKAVVKDSGFWGNTAETEIELLVDFSPPKIRLLSLQHVAVQGGTEFIVYEAEDSNMSSHGVDVGGYFFPGYKLEEASLGSQGAPKTYVSLFALPLGYEANGAAAQLIANDTAGNSTKIPIHFRLEKRAQSDFHMILKDAFLDTKTAELFPGYLRMASDEEKANNPKPDDMPEKLWKFRLINRNFRDLLDAELKNLFEKNSRPRQWKEVFIKPMSSATSSTFGEKRTYAYNDLDGGNSVHNGLDLASVNNDKVHAANDGVVVLSKDFGIYGNAVVIDHGLGLFSLYGHLASVDIKLEDKVTRGQEIGRSGQTGLAGGDHLHFEFRLRNTPVTPIEWWDAKWIKDNIDGKIEDLAEQ